LLDGALRETGVDGSLVYNAVKHVKFTERGKRRIHQTPAGPGIAACRRWLEAEIAAVRPRLLVALGARAGQSLAGRAVPVNAERGRLTKTRRRMSMPGWCRICGKFHAGCSTTEPCFFAWLLRLR
jgi:uracil-DNA glycosylase family 4